MELGSSAAWQEDERQWAEAETRDVVLGKEMPSRSEDCQAVDQVTQRGCAISVRGDKALSNLV